MCLFVLFLGMPKEQRPSAVCTYDFTWFNKEPEECKEVLKKYAKKWCFQQEKAPTTGNVHLQGRFSLKVKERPSTVRTKFPGAHLSVTSASNRDNDFYVTKEDTRIAGPWKDNDPFIPSDLRVFVPRPWQQEVLDIVATVPDRRTFRMIVDPVGKNGKSLLTAYMKTRGLARKIPLMDSSKDILRYCYGVETSRCYILDLPRAIDKSKINGVIAALECIKDGCVYDDRYSYKEKDFDPPHVIIFTNQVLDKSLLSDDRWIIYNIVDDKLVIV